MLNMDEVTKLRKALEDIAQLTNPEYCYSPQGFLVHNLAKEALREDK